MTRAAVTILLLCVAATTLLGGSFLSSATREHAAAGPALSLAAAVGYDELEAKVANIKKCGKAICS